jgi:CelD/BcsL family acetyltransferase involved in cellulose biosynthesis
MLHVETLSDVRALERLIPEWEALDASQFPRTPFTTPLWNMLWWQHLREHRRTLSDKLHSFAVYAPSGALVAVAPMMLTHRPASGPIRSRKLQFFGADPFMTEVRGLVAAPADHLAATAAIFDHLRRHRGGWDWLTWFGSVQQAPSMTCAPSGMAVDQLAEMPDYYLNLPPSWEELRSGFPPNTKEALRKCYKSLSRDGHEFILRTAQLPEDVPEGLATFFSLHTARAGAEEGLQHRDVFVRETAREFLSDYSAQMAARGQLRIFELIVDGKVVATRIGFALGREIYLYYSGFDPAWAKHNVMTTLMAEIMKWAIAQGAAVLNLSTGTDRSKTRWRPETVNSWSGTLVSPTWRGSLAHLAYEQILLGRVVGAMPSNIVARVRRSRA